ncbi:MAG TPA: AarF/ABC1/UbiB kinase family protein [Blastocatellia bacterium]|nr:AarF/ABC1/UbiB kinase family protein [Blastocatellia bacterium]
MNQIRMRRLDLPDRPRIAPAARRLTDYGYRGRLRLVRLSWAALKLKARLWAHSKSWFAGDAAPDALRRAEGAQIRDELIALGPTFIKIGQMLSTRVDLLPVEYTEELRQLLDSVPPFPTAQAFAIIENELGRPVSELYRTIDTYPIASASLGQVYRARLHDGSEVVVKVQRPNLESLIELDIATLRHIAPRLAASGLVKNLNWDDIIDEFAAVISDEIDYEQEVRNAERFRANFAKWPSILVPRMHHDLSTRRVITMEYVPGVKVDDHVGLKRLGLTPSVIAERLVETYLKQLLEDGFFHADPHPGNLRVMSDGKIAFFDFGMAGVISRDLQSQLVDAFFHIVERNWFSLLNDAITLGFLRVDPDDEEALKEIGERLISQYEGLRIGDLAFREMTDEVADVLYRYPFQIPAHFTFILRALTTLEGIGSAADPNFNFFQVARPYAKSFMLKREGRHIGGQLLSRVLRGEEGKVDWSKTWKLAKMAWRHYLDRR